MATESSTTVGDWSVSVEGRVSTSADADGAIVKRTEFFVRLVGLTGAGHLTAMAAAGLGGALQAAAQLVANRAPLEESLEPKPQTSALERASRQLADKARRG